MGQGGSMEHVDSPAARREESLAETPETVVRPFEDDVIRQTGRFAYDVKNDRWDWDDDVFAIHGYRPGEVEPTTELFLKHKHDGDRDRVEQTFKHATTTG